MKCRNAGYYIHHVSSLSLSFQNISLFNFISFLFKTVLFPFCFLYQPYSLNFLFISILLFSFRFPFLASFPSQSLPSSLPPPTLCLQSLPSSIPPPPFNLYPASSSLPSSYSIPALPSTIPLPLTSLFTLTLNLSLYKTICEIRYTILQG